MSSFPEAQYLRDFGAFIADSIDGQIDDDDVKWVIDRTFTDGAEFYFWVRRNRHRPGQDRSYTILIQESSEASEAAE